MIFSGMEKKSKSEILLSDSEIMLVGVESDVGKDRIVRRNGLKSTF